MPVALLRGPSARQLRRIALAGLACAPFLAQVASAQKFRASQRGTISQMLGRTRVSLDYSRPLARGRDSLFGKVVVWGELWTPGANEATVFDVSDTVTLNGQRVPAGRWSMWVIPSRVGPWELVLDPNDSLYHTQRPPLNDEQLRIPLEVHHDAQQTEALTWSFPRIAQDGATLRMNWGTTRIDLALGVRSIEPVITMTAADAAPYVGKWQVTFKPDPRMGRAPPPAVLTISHTDSGMLRATYPPGAFGPPPPPAEGAGAAAKPGASMTPQEKERAEARRKLAALEGGAFSYVLVPKARGVFQMGWFDDGHLYDVEEFYHEFELQDGRAVSASFRDDKDQVVATAKRVAP